MDNEIMREEFEQWVMTKIIISKSILVGLRTDDGYRNTTLSGRDYNSMWEAWVASRSALKPVAFTIKDDSGYLYLNRMTTQECDELNHQLNLLQKYCPLKQYSITPLYRLDK